MYVTGSDLAYASFSGPQDYPTRDSIVYIKDILPNQQVRRGNDLARTLGKKNPALVGLHQLMITTGDLSHLIKYMLIKN